MSAEDIRDLQGETPHGSALRGVQCLQRADHLTQKIGGHLRTQRRGIEPLVPEQHRREYGVSILAAALVSFFNIGNRCGVE
jgi:hypothetical protein